MIPGMDGTTLYQGTRSELGISSNGKYTRAEGSSNYQTVNAYTNYMLSIKDKHNFIFMGGYQEEKYNYRYLKNSVTDLISTTNPGIGLGTGDKIAIDTRHGWATRI